MSDRDDRSSSDRPTHTDQIRIVGADAAGDLLGGSDEFVDDEPALPPPREVLRFPRPRSVFESIPDAPPSFLDAWTVADDQMMRRIAVAGLNGLNGLITGTVRVQDEPVPAVPRSGPAIAQSDGNRPESASIHMQTLAFSAQ